MVLTAYVRDAEAPRLPPPANLTSLKHHLREHYFRSLGSGVMTILLGCLIAWLAWRLLGFAVLDAAWSGSTRDACLTATGEGGGACWPVVAQKFGQWIYGFYPNEERWRINVCGLAFVAGLCPMLIPSAPFKTANAIYLLVAFPLMAVVLLTGGNFDFPTMGYSLLAIIGLLTATLVPVAVFGFDEAVRKNSLGMALAGAAAIVWFLSQLAATNYVILGVPADSSALAIASGGVSLWVLVSSPVGRKSSALRLWAALLAAVVCGILFLDFDFGLAPVETSQWGGLTVTLVVSVTGIAASLPLGILLALGRQSRMPTIRIMSVGFIEFVRGVPLVTVLFMASVMLPLFLPPGMNFDKLVRALVGVALFSSAYMAEVVRGGLQAVPKGQYEGATALGLSYWQTMGKVILPQALKISIPNIVGNFIVLFKDTTLVLIIGLFDLLAMAQTGLRDAAWATPVTAPTGYLAIAIIYWVFCFSMSRYAIYTERRLHTGHKR